MDGLSMLDPGQIVELRQLVRNGLQTMLDFQDPQITATVEHWSEQVEDWVSITANPVPVVRTWANQLVGVQVQDASQGSAVRGEMVAFEPFAVTIGDRVLFSDGAVASVIAPIPVHEFGTVTATIESDQGAA